MQPQGREVDGPESYRRKLQGSHTFPSRSYTVCLYQTQIQINPSVMKPRGRHRSTYV